MEDFCEMCGNETDGESPICHFCGARQHGPRIRKSICFHRVVNIELGKPPVEQALAKLASELERARNDGVAVVTVIHGYGASGKGGAIRKECRKMLEFYKEHNAIRDYIAGERFSRKLGTTRALVRRFPQMLQNENLNRGNRGITVVEM